jgi:hypothetical protein
VGAQEIEHDDDGIVGVAEGMDLVAGLHLSEHALRLSLQDVKAWRAAHDVQLERRRGASPTNCPRENATSVG